MLILGAMTQRIVQSRPQTDRASARARRRPIELQTENNFCIIRRCDVDERSSAAGTEHCFVVRDPDGYQLDVTVTFSDSAIADAFERGCDRLTFESPFWLTSAERRLADYLWENDDYPPHARIVIDGLTPDDIDLIRRCGIDAGDRELEAGEK